MRGFNRSPRLLSFAAAVALAASVFGADKAYDNAADAAYNSGWANGTDGGFGFGGWSLAGGTNAGFFIGNSANNGGGASGNINTSGEAFGMFANSGAVASAVRSFDGGALQQGQSFYIRMDNGFIESGGTVGMGLQNSSGTNRIEFFFTNGQPNYRVFNGTTSTDTGVGFTADGLRLEFRIASGNQVRVIVKNNVGSSTLFDQMIGVASNSDITRFRLFNANAGSGGERDAFFNEMAVPEPGIVTALAGLAAILVRRRR
jgi:hypothetical protein